MAGHLMRVTIETDPEFKAGTPEVIFEPGVFEVNQRTATTIRTPA